ncbi:helix-turn-helix domain-containing protein [uncultured Leifsonia sp.]|uniref:helix-turn-helix domain-containing protein n=1 Tax=uncultured Leifsonia sp. TaxID=340359 RepID=UPI0028D4CF9A|nr:helix-turn-helix domain-containing protein [uncultured Leifsonia sp.]
MSQTTAAGPRSKGLLTPHPGAPVRIERRFPGEAAGAFVRHYWLPRWALPAGAEVRQGVLEYPTANLVVEADSVLLHRASRGLSVRALRGEGWAFGVMLRPGTARSWTGVSLRGLPPAIPLPALVPGTREAVQAAVPAVRDRMAAGDDGGALDAFEDAIAGLAAPGSDAALVDAIVAAVEEDRDLLRVEQLADRFGLGVRSLQRLVAGHIGFGPKWLIQRYRLQEAAALLRADDPPPIGMLAADLGYADQAHFTREFKAVVGATPGAYAAQVAAERAGAP